MARLLNLQGIAVDSGWRPVLPPYQAKDALLPGWPLRSVADSTGKRTALQKTC